MAHRRGQITSPGRAKRDEGRVAGVPSCMHIRLTWQHFAHKAVYSVAGFTLGTLFSHLVRAVSVSYLFWKVSADAACNPL